MTPATVYPQALRKERFACKCGCFSHFEMDQGIVDILRAVQAHFGGELIVTSGHRCREHNARVGGVEGSHHMRGRAVDFVILGTPPETVADFVQAVIGERAGIGVKPASVKGSSKTGFVHVDLRGPPGARWKYQEAKP